MDQRKSVVCNPGAQNADFDITKVMIDKANKYKAKGVFKEQFIAVGVIQNGIVVERLILRRIEF